jgi:MoxR-like ATPase
MQHLYDATGLIGWPVNLSYAIFGCLAADLNILFTGEPGCGKTKFAQDLAKLLAYSYRTYEMDKMDEDTFYGNLSPSWLGQTSKSLLGIQKVLMHMANLREMVEDEEDGADPGPMYVDSIFDYDVIIFDEILRAPPNIQAMLLRVYQDREFAGKPVKALRISATNRGTDDLYAWNEPLLNRYHLIVEAPHLRHMSHEDSDRIINECGLNKDSKDIRPNPELIEKFNELREMFSKKPGNNGINRSVKQFLKHLKTSLMDTLKSRFSGRSVDNIAQVLYVTLCTYSLMNKVKFSDIPRDKLWELLRDTFMSCIYMHDLDDEKRGAVRNAFFLAFGYTFDVERLTLETRIGSVPSFTLNCEDFFEHIRAHANDPDNQDIVGISMFLRKLKKECENDEPRRYLLYKWLMPKIDKYGVFAEKDLIDPIRNKLNRMQNKMDEFRESQAKVQLSAETLNSEFLQKIKAADANKVFSDQRRNPKLWAGLVTTVQVFGPEKAEESDDYLSKTYSLLAHLSSIKEEDDSKNPEEGPEGPVLPSSGEASSEEVQGTSGNGI